MGGDLMVHLAVFAFSLYQALMARGHLRDGARDLVADVAWRMYAKMGDVAGFASAPAGQDAFRRLRYAVDAFLAFPFSSPAYQWKAAAAGDRTCAFGMVRCPVVEHFRTHGPDMGFLQASCDLDYRLAERWGGATLQRTQTLADGAPCCNVRFQAAGAGSGAQGQPVP